MYSLELFLFGTAVLLMLCVMSSKASGKFGIPTLVVFLGVGILAGSEGIGGIYFDNAYYAKTLGVVALSYILFSGGLDTKMSAVKPVIKSAVSLATIGVILTSFIIACFVHFILNFSFLESFLIGAIISSTDAGAVFTVLRSRNIHLKGNLASLLEVESGSNDPMAVFLVTSILSMMEMQETSILLLFPKLLQQMFIGGAVGYFGGKAIAFILNKMKLEFEGLYVVFSLATVLTIYTSSQLLSGNGFLAVYVAGVILGNETFVYKKTLMLFHDGVSWLMQSSMFLTLGLLIFPSRVMAITDHGIFVAAIMIVLARPVSVFLSLAFSQYNWREKLLISWVGLRGAVPIVMATYPLVAGIKNADYIFNLVFFTAVLSLLVQGTTISMVAKWLDLEDNSKAEKKIVEHTTNATLNKNLNYLTIREGAEVVDKSIVDLKLPENILIVLIEREGRVIVPRGGTQLKPQDKLMIVGEKEIVGQMRPKF